jgi:hypothetical protein
LRNQFLRDQSQKSPSAKLFGDADEAFLQVGRFGSIEFDHKSSSAFERNTHDQASSLFGYFHWAVAGAWFHCRHKEYPLH